MSKLPDLLRVFDGAYLPPSATASNTDGVSHLLTVTASVSTNPSWLLQHFARASIGSFETLGRGDKNVETPAEKAPVMYISFLQDLEFYKRSLKKAGVDIGLLIHQKQFVFVDGFSNLFGEILSKRDSLASLYLQSKKSAHWPAQIENLVSELGTSHGAKPLIIVEGFEILHALGVLSPADILRLVRDLQELSGILVVCVSSSDAILKGPTTLATGQEELFVSLIHRSLAVFAIRPLDSGIAEDVTGTIRITRGGQPAEDGGSHVIEEGEYHYFVGDGNLSGVRVFEKGHP
ncbi:uncharacterized protein V2V93DRAFT_368464 [Kockiozyma suomiensis]|uniref:uncharacterized protein n=1 Tax=Kockiozyma suomiensis TaxID=1337062 RepID=UPI0033431781